MGILYFDLLNIHSQPVPKKYFPLEESGTPLELYSTEMIPGKLKWLCMENLPITTVETNVRLAESMIENHINNMHHAKKSFGNRHLDELIWENFESMSWCCEHSPVEGTIDISFLLTGNDVKHISVPVFTNFGVVCTRVKEKSYRITWSYSLS